MAKGNLPARHRAVVERVVADARPVRRLLPPGTRLLLWVALVFGILGLVVRFHLRPDAAAMIGTPLFLAQLVTLALAAGGAGELALRAAVPGDGPTAVHATLPAVAAAAGVALLLLEPGHPVARAAFVAQGVPCVGLTLLLAAAPWASLLIAVRRGAPLSAGRAAAWIGAGALLAACALMRLACASDDRFHLLAWHVAPVAAGIALSGLAGGPLLGRWRARTT